MNRLPAALLAGAAIVISGAYYAVAQSKPAQATAGSSEWPTYGHDPGGMRFSPLTQITPANVGQLNVAWVYHMKPQAAAVPAGAGAAVPAQGRGGRGRGSGFAPS